MAKESYRRANFRHEEKLAAAESARTGWLIAAGAFLFSAFAGPLIFPFGERAAGIWILVNVVLFALCYLRTAQDTP